MAILARMSAPEPGQSARDYADDAARFLTALTGADRRLLYEFLACNVADVPLRAADYQLGRVAGRSERRARPRRPARKGDNPCPKT